MANATALPNSTNLFIGQWSKKDATTPRLAAPIDIDDTTITVTAALKNNAGTVVTGAFLMGIKKSDGWTEIIWVPAGGASADGLTLSNCVRGIKPDGYDYTVGDSDFADSHNQDELVFCVIPAVIPELIRSVLQGLIATGAADFIIGIDAAGTITIKRSTGTGTSVGFLRWYTTTSKVEYSNDGTNWTAIDDATASVIFKISSADTTPGYGEDKIQAGSGITITKRNTGGNEYLEISTSFATTFTEHATYTPAYLTGDTGAQSDYRVWNDVTDGEFAITIDGDAYDITGIDFTGDGDMDDVAATIQAAIRAATSSTETCVWSTDHFVITSVDTTVDSEVSVLSTVGGGSGTDISGAGADDWMDADTGNGTATAAVLDETADAGKVVLMDTDGNIDKVVRGQSAIMVAGESIDGSTTPQALYISDGSNGRTAGRVYKADANDVTNMAVRIFGFTRDNVTAGQLINVQFEGIVGGFTGLTQGVDYYLSSTAGAISNTIATNPIIRAGRAKSATELEIHKDAPTVMGYVATATGVVAENNYIDVTITTGFRPRAMLMDFTCSDLGSGKVSISSGQWNSGTQYWWFNYDGGNTNLATTGRLNENLSEGDYWEITVQSFSDNTVTLRYTMRGGGATGSTIYSGLLIFG